ncbi:hypothetical protein VTJ49DRAFT_4280 [Mycothermus thermophilus]|uniref:Uncharacterized protein n=1 Tax=Humicola insolens TaxID=85995 RepID=A0ABR3V655_HUMIN
MKHTSSMLLTAVTAAGLAAAQASTTTVSVLLPFADHQDIEGSVISAGPTATNYFLTCPTGARDTECGFGDGISVLYGPSTLTYAMSFTGLDEKSSTMSYSIGASCSLDLSKDIATCTATMVSGTDTTTYREVAESFTEYIMPVTITAGAEKLQAAATGGSGGEDSPATTPAPTPTGGSDAARASDGTSSNAAMPRITQNAVVMGAAALVGGAMLL